MLQLFNTLSANRLPAHWLENAEALQLHRLRPDMIAYISARHAYLAQWQQLDSTTTLSTNRTESDMLIASATLSVEQTPRFVMITIDVFINLYTAIVYQTLRHRHHQSHNILLQELWI